MQYFSSAFFYLHKFFYVLVQLVMEVKTELIEIIFKMSYIFIFYWKVIFSDFVNEIAYPFGLLI